MTAAADGAASDGVADAGSGGEESLTASEAAELIREHARLRHGAVAGLSPEEEGVAHLVNPSCGDRVTVRPVVDHGGVVTAIEWDGRGCEVSQASASMLSAAVADAHAAETPFDTGDLALLVLRFRAFIRDLGEAADAPGGIGDAVALAGIGRLPVRGTCAVLAWNALDQALTAR